MWQAHNIHHDSQEGNTQQNKQKTRGLRIEWDTCLSETSACTSREGSSDSSTAWPRQRRQAIWWRRETTEPSWHHSYCWLTIKLISWSHPPFFVEEITSGKYHISMQRRQSAFQKNVHTHILLEMNRQSHGNPITHQKFCSVSFQMPIFSNKRPSYNLALKI